MFLFVLYNCILFLLLGGDQWKMLTRGIMVANIGVPAGRHVLTWTRVHFFDDVMPDLFIE